MSEIQKSGDKTSSGEIGLDIRTHASPKVGQDQVSGGVSVPCWHATPVADALRKPISGEMSDSVKMSSPVIMSQTGMVSKAKEKYRGVFEIQRSGDKTSSGEIGLDIRTHASPKVGQDN